MPMGWALIEISALEVKTTGGQPIFVSNLSRFNNTSLSPRLFVYAPLVPTVLGVRE